MKKVAHNAFMQHDVNLFDSTWSSSKYSLCCVCKPPYIRKNFLKQLLPPEASELMV